MSASGDRGDQAGEAGTRSAASSERRAEERRRRATKGREGSAGGASPGGGEARGASGTREPDESRESGAARRADEPREPDQARPAEEPSPLESEESVEANLLLALPGLARIGVAAWWRTTGWVAGASVQAGSRVLRAAASGESAAELFQAAGSELRDYARRALRIVGETDQDASGAETPEKGEGGSSLRDKGADLLRRSADVHHREDEAHPAYARILDQLAPDEGRVLRLLALYGPQPSVDVRTGTLPINVGSELVAPGLTMIGAEAGCRNPSYVPAYLNNLFRLGLIWFSREPVPDPTRYQVLEAQPEVVEAMAGAGRSRTVRRSIHLTPFGEDFCETCLPLHTAELEALPGGELGGDSSGDAEREE